jgi:hypothetical protein
MQACSFSSYQSSGDPTNVIKAMYCTCVLSVLITLWPDKDWSVQFGLVTYNHTSQKPTIIIYFFNFDLFHNIYFLIFTFLLHSNTNANYVSYSEHHCNVYVKSQKSYTLTRFEPTIEFIIHTLSFPGLERWSNIMGHQGFLTNFSLMWLLK